MGYFPQWKLKEKGRGGPDERLPTGQTVAMGVQHVVGHVRLHHSRPDSHGLLTPTWRF